MAICYPFLEEIWHKDCAALHKKMSEIISAWAEIHELTKNARVSRES